MEQTQISGLQTIALVLLTGVVGASLARWQGFRTVRRIQDELAAGRGRDDADVSRAVEALARVSSSACNLPKR